VPRRRPDLGTDRAKRSRKVPEGPPDPEKRRAAPAGTEGGPNRKISKSRSPRKTTLRPEKSQASKRANLAVYSGQVLLGLIEVRQGGSDFAAFTSGGRFIGSFPSLKAAADAVDAAASGGGL
jgi:hypothetical protein